MILYAEVATWLIRAAIFTFWLSGTIGGDLVEKTNGPIQGFLPRCLLLIIGGLTMNLILMGWPKLRASKKPLDIILLDNYEIDSFKTLIFLLQGAKVKEVIRNVGFFSGSKRVSITADGSILIVENTQAPKSKDYFVTIGILVVGLVVLFAAPVLMYAIFSLSQQLLSNAPPTMVRDFVKYFSFFILGYYTFRYVLNFNSYLDSSVCYFAKPLMTSVNGQVK